MRFDLFSSRLISVAIPYCKIGFQASLGFNKVISNLKNEPMTDNK